MIRRGTDAATARRVASCATSAALAVLLSAGVSPFAVSAASAQGVDDLRSQVSENAPLLLQADTLVYNNDAETISAVGGVRIDYDGIRLVAMKVTYHQQTGRLVAEGDVLLIDRTGNKFTGDRIDVTDDLASGFVDALRVETTDNTRFAAERATKEGDVTTFDKGLYTACEPCKDNPEKPPVWQIKAQKIVWNGEVHTIRFERARFEFFGFSLFELPAFEIADHTVKRKSGFLIPSIHYKSELGYGGSIPYYFALSPSYDLTVTGRGYSRQGFLGEAEWRQRFENGEISIKAAGIHQEEPTAFRANTVDAVVDDRGMIGTKGRFEINPRWTFGWDALLQSDKNFSRTYDIEGFNEAVHTSQIYLTGLHDRSFFDLRAQHFTVQEPSLDTAAAARQNKQPDVLPTFDYAHTPDMPIAGGELNIDINARVLDRKTEDFVDLGGAATYQPMLAGLPFGDRLPGAAGSNGRVTAEVEWKRMLIAPGGLAITPILALQGDAGFADPDFGTASAVAAAVQGEYYRGMATAGLEVRWPVLFSAASSSHVLEPIAQIFVRPDERYSGTGSILNEDAQSLVFDSTNLFTRDKFSGKDRVEGGTRANLGIRYTGSFANGWAVNAVFGQSYHLGGTNSFAQADYVNAGAFSGLETDVSDFVGGATVISPEGFALWANGRFDEKTFTLRRADAGATVTADMFTLSANYTFIDAQPGYGFATDRHDIGGAGTLKLAENWSALASATYDFASETLVKSKIGLSYDDECFTFQLAYIRTEETRVPKDVTHSIGFYMSFRTLGDFGVDQAIDN